MEILINQGTVNSSAIFMQKNSTQRSDTASAQLKSFKESAVALAQEDLRYKAEKKSTLNTSLSCVILN